MTRLVQILKHVGVVGVVVLGIGCATPREAERVYNNQPRQTVVICNEGDLERLMRLFPGGIVLNAPVSITADVQKKQETSATATISPTVDVTP